MRFREKGRAKIKRDRKNDYQRNWTSERAPNGQNRTIQGPKLIVVLVYHTNIKYINTSPY